MDLITKAENIGELLSNSKEFKEYKELYNTVYKAEKNKNMIDNFRKKIVEYQIKFANQGKESEEEMEKLENLQNVLMLNPDIAKFMAAEATFSLELKSVYDAIEKAIQLD